MQPHQPKAVPLRPGETPPQFVVISWDGAGEVTGLELFSHFLGVAREHEAAMTFFLSGIFLLPRSRAQLYHPPRHRVGASDIGYLDDHDIRSTIEQLGAAWRDGHEIGTHFNGHFCGPGGVGDWSVADWTSEIEQAKRFVRDWKANTGFTDLPDLPFDYDTELVGGRTPCLEGADNLRTAAVKLGFRYDSSKTRPQTWPDKDKGLWDLSLQSIPFAGRGGTILSMDYNFMANQRGDVHDAGLRRQWQQQTADSYVAGFRRAYDGNRAPLIIGNHFENWRSSIYMRAVEDAMTSMAAHPDTRFVSMRQLCDWLDVQHPEVLARLRSLAPGTAPTGGWKTVVRG